MGAQRGPPGADLSGGSRVGSRHGNGVGDGWGALTGRTPWCERGEQRGRLLGGRVLPYFLRQRQHSVNAGTRGVCL